MTISPGGLVIHRKTSTHNVSWHEIATIHAHRRDALIGDVISLTIKAKNGIIAQAAEHDPEWLALREGINAYLPRAIQSSDWEEELEAGTPSLIIYQA
jgi:hypothetical protein